MQKSIRYKFNFSRILEIGYFGVIFLGLYVDAMVPFVHAASVMRNWLIILLLILSAIYEDHTRTQWFILIGGLIIYLFGLLNHYNNLEELILVSLMFAMSNSNPKKIIRGSVILIFVFLLIVTLASKIGIIQNLLFYREGAVRQSLGMMHPLTYAGFILYACSGLVVTSKNNNIWWKILLLILCGLFIYKVNGARNDTVGMFFLVLCLFSTFLPEKINKVISYFLIILLPVMIFISIFSIKYISYTSNFYPIINDVLHGRLDLQMQVWSFFEPKFFGQFILQNGLGRSTQKIVNYFYIDNSYLRLLFMNGILFFVLFLIIFFSLIYRLMHHKLYKVAFVIIVLAFAGITEDSFINPLMNIFIMMFITPTPLLVQSFKEIK